MEREKFNSMFRMSLVRIGKGKQLNVSSKMRWVIVGFITAVVLVFFILMSIPAAVKVNEEVIHISGLYGDKIPVSEVVSVEILEKMPPVRQRLNGSDMGRYLKGRFQLQNDEKCNLFIRRDMPPFIELRTSDNLYYFNRKYAEDTRSLFEVINQTTKKRRLNNGEG